MDSRKSRFHDFTGVEFMDFWLKSIFTYAAPGKGSTQTATDKGSTGAMPKGNSRGTPSYKSPPILIVGTHRNLDQTQRDIKQQVSKLNTFFSSYFNPVPRWLQLRIPLNWTHRSESSTLVVVTNDVFICGF